MPHSLRTFCSALPGFPSTSSCSSFRHIIPEPYCVHKAAAAGIPLYCTACYRCTVLYSTSRGYGIVITLGVTNEKLVLKTSATRRQRHGGLKSVGLTHGFATTAEQVEPTTNQKLSALGLGKHSTCRVRSSRVIVNLTVYRTYEFWHIGWTSVPGHCLHEFLLIQANTSLSLFPSNAQ